MTQDEIISMAKQTLSKDIDGLWLAGIEDLEAFAKLVASAAIEKEREAFRIVTAAETHAAILAEREACAKVCENDVGDGPDNGCCPTYWNEATECCAQAIRARGEPTSRGETK